MNGRVRGAVQVGSGCEWDGEKEIRKQEGHLGLKRTISCKKVKFSSIGKHGEVVEKNNTGMFEDVVGTVKHVANVELCELYEFQE